MTATLSRVLRSWSVSSMRRTNDALRLSRPEPVEERRAHAADVQVAGRRRGEADARRGHDATSSRAGWPASTARLRTRRLRRSPGRADRARSRRLVDGIGRAQRSPRPETQARTRTVSLRPPRGAPRSAGCSRCARARGRRRRGRSRAARRPRARRRRTRARRPPRGTVDRAQASARRVERAAIDARQLARARAAQASSWRARATRARIWAWTAEERRVALGDAQRVPCGDADAPERRRRGAPETATAAQASASRRAESASTHDRQHADDRRARRWASGATRARCCPTASTRAPPRCAGARARGRRGEARGKADPPAAAHAGIDCPVGART